MATAPKLSLKDIEANIASEHYFTAFDGATAEEVSGNAIYDSDWEVPRSIEALQKLTLCVLVLRNGFTVVGESACISPENFDAQRGREIAREHAVEKVWPLMGYALSCKNADNPKTEAEDSEYRGG